MDTLQTYEIHEARPDQFRLHSSGSRIYTDEYLRPIIELMIEKDVPTATMAHALQLKRHSLVTRWRRLGLPVRPPKQETTKCYVTVLPPKPLDIAAPEASSSGQGASCSDPKEHEAGGDYYPGELEKFYLRLRELVGGEARKFDTYMVAQDIELALSKATAERDEWEERAKDNTAYKLERASSEKVRLRNQELMEERDELKVDLDRAQHDRDHFVTQCAQADERVRYLEESRAAPSVRAGIGNATVNAVLREGEDPTELDELEVLSRMAALEAKAARADQLEQEDAAITLDLDEAGIPQEDYTLVERVRMALDSLADLADVEATQARIWEMAGLATEEATTAELLERLKAQLAGPSVMRWPWTEEQAPRSVTLALDTITELLEGTTGYCRLETQRAYDPTEDTDDREARLLLSVDEDEYIALNHRGVVALALALRVIAQDLELADKMREAS